MLVYRKKNIWLFSCMLFILIFIVFLLISNDRNQRSYINVIKEAYRNDIDGIATQVADISKENNSNNDLVEIEIFTGNKQEGFGGDNEATQKNKAIMQLFKSIPSLKAKEEVNLNQLTNKYGHIYYIWHNVQYKERNLFRVETKLRKLEIFVVPGCNEIALFKDYEEKDLNSREFETVVLYETNDTVRNFLKAIIGLD